MSDQRELAFKKLRPSRDYLHAIGQVRSNPTIYFEVLVESPNAFDVLDALDQTIDFMERNDADATVRRIRSNVGRAFAMEAGHVAEGHRTWAVVHGEVLNGTVAAIDDDGHYSLTCDCGETVTAVKRSELCLEWQMDADSAACEVTVAHRRKRQLMMEGFSKRKRVA